MHPADSQVFAVVSTGTMHCSFVGLDKFSAGATVRMWIIVGIRVHY